MKARTVLLLLATLPLACRPQDEASVAQYSRPQIGYDRFGQPAKTQLSEVVVTGVAEASLPFTPPDAGSLMVIRTANISIEVDSLEPAIAKVRHLAAQFGGYVANTDITTGKARLRNAKLELKVPANRFDESLQGVAPIGKLESVSVEAEDVGEEFVDVSARMDNARRLERRLIDLLATRAGKLKDVLDVEQALAQVREEIERYDGRIRYLRTHVGMSTLSVYVHEPVPIVATAGRSVMGEAFRQAWRNFVTLLSVAVQSLGVILPLGFVAGIVLIFVRRVRLERARQRTA